MAVSSAEFGSAGLGVYADPIGVLIDDLNRVVAPGNSSEETRGYVTAFIADAIKSGLPPETYNRVLGNFVNYVEASTAFPHLRPCTGRGREKFTPQII